MSEQRVFVDGTISSAAFRTGDRFVIGNWHTSPIGAMFDVMWATPTDERILLVDSKRAADFITQIYDFDDVRVVDLAVAGDDSYTTVSSRDLTLHLTGARRWSLNVSRPLWVTKWIERPVARTLLGVHTYGTSPAGAVEWYQARGVRWVDSGRAHLRGEDLGAPQSFTREMGVGFSEPPKRPTIVSVKVTIDLPSPSGVGPSHRVADGDGAPERRRRHPY